MIPLSSLLSLTLVLAAPSEGRRGAGVPRATADDGVVVEDVASGSAAAKAGILPGDRLLGWSRAANPPANPEPASGRVGSPFDLEDVETEQAPRGPLTLIGSRAGEEMRWVLPPGGFGVTSRPELGDAARALHEQALEHRRKAAPGEAAPVWQRAGDAARRGGDCRLAAWFYDRAGQAFADAQSYQASDAAFEEALERSGCGDEPRIRALLLRNWARRLEKRSDRRATDRWAGALALWEETSPDSLAVARGLFAMGTHAWVVDDLDTAADYYRRALALRESLAPESEAVADSLLMLGATASSRGDVEAEEKHWLAALAIYTRIDPLSLDSGGLVLNLGNVACERGDLTVAQERYERALAIFRTRAPEGEDVARALFNLGSVARQRGDVASAEERYREALRIRERLMPQSVLTADVIVHLGEVARLRGDLATAEDRFTRYLAAVERVVPGSQRVAQALESLGLVALDRGDLTAAADRYTRALEIRQRAAPQSLATAATLRSLGSVAKLQGDLEAAEAWGRRALSLQETLSNGLDVAETLQELGDVARRKGDTRTAEERLRRALGIREKLAPGSAALAESLHLLGLTHRQAGRPDSSAAFLAQAMDVLDSQSSRLGGSQEERSAFASRYRGYYHDAMEALVERGQPEQAFHALERSRARTFLNMLAERDLLLTADLPAEISHERRENALEYDRCLAALARLQPGKDDAEMERLRVRLQDLREKREAVVAAVRRSSPRLASLQYPQPLDATGAGSALDPGTALLAYSVGPARTLVFVVSATEAASPGGPKLSVLTLPIGREALEERVQGFREVIRRRDPADGRILAEQGRELYDLLVRPAEGLVASSERLLLSPDGPLHILPFAALVRAAGQDGGLGTHLIEWKPLHVVSSATVYAEVRRNPSTASDSRPDLVAFGDPKYPALSKEEAAAIADPALRSAVQNGLALAPLPSSRKEVESIASLYGETAIRYLGEQATEERAKSLGGGARYVHFACHGLLQERWPLDSALALTIPDTPLPGQDNGLLQAWEIFEKVRIDAELVTLSACGTALGKEMGGEGLLGLTRAFQYAGARSVVASLWAVDDEATAALMKSFYAYLRAGLTKDRALQSAQRDLLRDPAVAHPAHWAAFTLTGDYR